MLRWFIRFSALLFLLWAVLLTSLVSGVQAKEPAQIPTVAVPTVTGTPAGAIATVSMEQETVNVRSGPSSYDYPIIGMLIAGQQVPALGRTPGGDWIQIAYPGVPGGVAWVWSLLVKIDGTLPMIEPPPTPTPRTTPTVDPTLASQFILEIQPTRLPTYTAPPPLVYPTFQPETASASPANVPMGFVIIGMGVIGLFGMVISFLRGR
jgi:hypothetical protein